MSNQPYPNDAGYVGAQDDVSPTSKFNALVFLVQQVLSRVNTMTPVKVIACTNDGGLSPVGFVDVQPLVNQVDGLGNSVPHGVIYHVPYVRVQGGVNAVILDPVQGDIGYCGFCDHDISSVKSNKAQANPGSWRRFDMADGIYLGGILNGIPQNYVQFASDGTINVTSTAAVNVSAPTATVTAATEATVTAPSILLGATGQTLRGLVTDAFETVYNSHTHSDPQGGTTGAPNQLMDASDITTTVQAA